MHFTLPHHLRTDSTVIANDAVKLTVRLNLSESGIVSQRSVTAKGIGRTNWASNVTTLSPWRCFLSGILVCALVAALGLNRDTPRWTTNLR